MADYRVVLRIENPNWQENCPLQIKALQVSRDIESAACFLQARVLNIGNKSISAIVLTGDVSARDGIVEPFEITSLDNHLLPGDSIALPPFALKLTEPQDIFSKICRVDDLEEFGEDIPLPNASTLELSGEAVAERADQLLKYGVDPSICSGQHEEHGDWWLCGCGALNYIRNHCHRCGVDKTVLNGLENEALLEEQTDSRVIEKAKAALSGNNAAEMDRILIDLEGVANSQELCGRLREKSAELKEFKESQARQEKQRRMTIAARLMAVVVIAVAGIALFNCSIRPIIKLRHAEKQAEELISNGEYFKAGSIYEELGIDIPDDLASEITETEKKQKEKHNERLGDSAYNDGHYMEPVSRYEKAGTSTTVTSKLNVAKYAYVTNYAAKKSTSSSTLVNSIESTTCKSYLHDLIDAGYSDAQKLFDKLFG